MAAPVIDTTSSVLANPQHFPWAHQFAASNTPTSWTIASGGFPPGMTFDTDTGYLSGAATLPGVYLVRLTATNGDGTSPEVLFTIGIEAGAPRSDMEIELNWDVVTGRVARRTLSTTATAAEVTAPLFAVKEDDDLKLRVFLVKGTTPVAAEVVDLQLVLKQFEPEGVVLASTGFLADGEGTAATWLLHAKVTGAEIAARLAENEGDTDTSFVALAELELTVQNPWWNIPATLVTSLAGDDNDLGFEAVPLGDEGNGISIEYVDPESNDATLSIVVTGTDIVVNLATDSGGAITSTAEEIAAAILADEDAAALVTVFLPPSAAALTGVVTAMAAQSLSGGRVGIGGEVEIKSSRTFRILVERDLATND